MGPKGKASGGKGKSAPPPPQPEKGKKGAKGSSGGSGEGSAASGSKKGGKPPPRPDGQSDKQSKAARKLEREERERQRVADRDDMMAGMPSYDSDEGDGHSHSNSTKAHNVEFPGVSKKKAKDLTTDKFGNTVSKCEIILALIAYIAFYIVEDDVYHTCNGDLFINIFVHVAKLEEEKKIAEMRAAARARREAKEEEKRQKEAQMEEEETQEKKIVVPNVEELDAKLGQGLKLSHKGMMFILGFVNDTKS